MALDPAAMQTAIIDNLPARTGRTLEQWIELLDRDGPTRRAERIAWLKGQGVGHVTAQIIADRAATPVAPYTDGVGGFLDALFGTEGDPRRDRYVAVRDALVGIVPGTTVTVCKGYVGFSLRRQYAAVRASGDAIEVGLRLPADGVLLQPAKRLGGGAITGSFVCAGSLDAAHAELVRRAAGVAP